jgi:hypothetical protein
VRLYAVVVMVVLVASAVAELLVLARLAGLTVLSDRNRRSIGDDASSILASSQFARGGYEPEKLEIHCPEEVAYPPTGVQPIYREQRLLVQATRRADGWIGANGQGHHVFPYLSYSSIHQDVDLVTAGLPRQFVFVLPPLY